MPTQSDQHPAERRTGNDATRSGGSDPSTFREGPSTDPKSPAASTPGIRRDLDEAGDGGQGGDAGGVGKSL